MKVKLVSVVALFVLLLGACSVPKDVVYFQGGARRRTFGNENRSPVGY